MNFTVKKKKVSTATPGRLQSDVQFYAQDDSITTQAATATVVMHFQGAETHFFF